MDQDLQSSGNGTFAFSNNGFDTYPNAMQLDSDVPYDDVRNYTNDSSANEIIPMEIDDNSPQSDMNISSDNSSDMNFNLQINDSEIFRSGFQIIVTQSANLNLQYQFQQDDSSTSTGVINIHIINNPQSLQITCNITINNKTL
ncbi:hypothetical protein C1645_738895 [Glomus cerebriforme]|uniref:Uncharacterized protein n=1 Tax=Glomus cerebriforme TaxID=658196 RepID=A0A397SYM5_9GLOM|nr:hypothetical protein C1645_738895 [Glomus cerebriforme]